MAEYQPKDPFISQDEVEQWLNEALQNDPRRLRHAEGQIFQAVCWTFMLVVIGYGVLSTLGTI
jgi:hypothetical protein